MAKKQRSVSLSFVLLRFAVVMLGCMVFCCLIALLGKGWLQKNGAVYQGYVSSQQVEQLLAGEQAAFVAPGDDFLTDYVWFGPSGEVLASNATEKKQEELSEYLRNEAADGRNHITRHTYPDGSTALFHLVFRAEFANPALRAALPPFEHLWLTALGVALVLCLLVNTLWLRRSLAAKLKLFSEVSEKVAAQELDFTVPHAGIREYDQALGAMEHMRKALHHSLSAEWAAQHEREAAIAALAHDLKTPLTLVGGNAELLLDEELPEKSRRMVETIASSNGRAKQYVSSLLETSGGADIAYVQTGLSAMLDEVYRNTKAIAEVNGVSLEIRNSLAGTANMQKEHMVRALGNVVQNAIEHTPAGGSVIVDGNLADDGWQVVVRDEGAGFSKAALRHATERLWRDDPARSADGHQGLGLWFAAEVAKAHGGQLELGNGDSGGVVALKFGYTSSTKVFTKEK